MITLIVSPEARSDLHAIIEFIAAKAGAALRRPLCVSH